MVINPVKLDAAFYTFDLSFRKGLEAITSIYPAVTKMVTSPSREMRYAWAANIPGFRKWLQGTERVFNNISGRVYTLTNDHYEDSLEVGFDDINDDQLGIYNDGFYLLGVNAGAQPDVLVFAAIEAGITALGYDAVAFFSNAHPVSLDNPALGTYNNQFTTAGGDARVLNAANFAYVRAKLQSNKLENGLPLALGKLTLVVPTDLRTTAEQLMNSTFFAPGSAYGAIGTAGGSDNTLRGAADIVVSPYLTNNGANSNWYLISKLGDLAPFIYQVRQPVKFVSLINPSDPNIFNLNVARYGGDVRNASGYSFPQMAAMAGA